MNTANTTLNPTEMNTTETPRESHSIIRRSSGLGLFIAAACVIAATWFAGSVLPSSAKTPYELGPVTGDEFAAFLLSNEDRLRAVTSDFEGLLADAKAVGDQPMIDWLRYKHELEATTTE